MNMGKRYKENKPGGHPVTLYVRRHLDSDASSIVKVLQHVMALGVFQRPAEGFLQGEMARPAL